MRIKVNGPDDISNFAAAKYAKKWVDDGHLLTDSKIGTKSSDIDSNIITKDDDDDDMNTNKKHLLKSTIF